MNNKQIFNNLGPFGYEDFMNLFHVPKMHYKKKNLFVKKFKQIVGSHTVAQCIFKDFSKSEIVFDQTDLDYVFNDISIENFSKKEILNILLSINQKFIDKILEHNLFDKIYIINEEDDFEKEALNINDEREISNILLEKKNLKPQIFIKRLMNKKCEFVIKHLDHLEKCIYLLPYSDINFENEECLDFILTLELNYLKQIMTKFNLRKYLFRFINYPDVLEMNEIENLIFINGNIIDMDILYILLDNYYQIKDHNHDWLRKIFKKNDICYNNYQMAEWILANTELYEDNYLKIDEFHKFCHRERRVCQLFFSSNVFFVKLAEPIHIMQYLNEINNVNQFIDDEDKHRILAKMVEFIFKYTTHPEFKIFLEHPENLLFHLNRIKNKFSKNFDKKLQLTLKFKNHDIKTSVKELLQAKTWDDLSDFCEKLKEDTIKIGEVSDLKLKELGNIAKSKKLLNEVVHCCICFETKDDLYLFSQCSHLICLSCMKNYLEKTLNLSFKKKKSGNKIMFILNISRTVPCPNCKKDNVVQKNRINILKFFS